ncbi:MAG: T9SS type A sorting domain-containing protein, partial [Nanoarchaeota archaeon]
MKIFKKLGLAGLLIGALNLGFNSEASSQIKRIRVIDAIDGKGIPNLYVNINDTNKYRTNDSGYTDVSTGVNDIKDPNKLENKDFLSVDVRNMNANFNFYGYGTLIGYDILGREVFRKDGKDNVSWNLANLPAGFYGYVLKKDDKIQTGKLISDKTGIYLGSEANK